MLTKIRYKTLANQKYHVLYFFALLYLEMKWKDYGDAYPYYFLNKPQGLFY
jgi:hypothetical protein